MQGTPTLVDDPLLSTSEVAAQLGIHKLSVYRFLRENPEFPKPIRVFSNRLAWRQSQIEAFVKGRPTREQARAYKKKPGRPAKTGKAA